MMHLDQLRGRIRLLIDNFVDERRIIDERLKDDIDRYVKGTMLLFGYDDIPSDFMKISFDGQEVTVTIDKKYLTEWNMIVI